MTAISRLTSSSTRVPRDGTPIGSKVTSSMVVRPRRGNPSRHARKGKRAGRDSDRYSLYATGGYTAPSTDTTGGFLSLGAFFGSVGSSDFDRSVLRPPTLRRFYRRIVPIGFDTPSPPFYRFHGVNRSSTIESRLSGYRRGVNRQVSRVSRRLLLVAPIKTGSPSRISILSDRRFTVLSITGMEIT